MNNSFVKPETELYIQDSQSLIELCHLFAQSPILVIDTEFVRTRTLYPKLGLLQVYNGKVLALIDPIAIDDLSPFWALLIDNNICKVLHACSEDLEVFLTAANFTAEHPKPVNVMDSQIMLSFLGHGLSMGYAAMIQHFTGIELDKSESRTDWTKRPLSDKQLTYAKADVEHLYNIYPELLKQLESAGWLQAAQQETQRLIERKFTPIDENNLYRKVKMNWRLNAQQLNNLKFLTVWRYQKAQQRNLPIGFIVKDNTLMSIAANNPTSLHAMNKLEGAEVLDIKYQGKAMLAILQQANDVAADDYPTKLIRLDEYPDYKQIFKQMKSFIGNIAVQEGLSNENLASKKQINQFITWFFNINSEHSSVNVNNNTEANETVYQPSVDVLQGWRLSLFGEQLVQFAKNQFNH